jgi:hypothetical protein
MKTFHVADRLNHLYDSLGLVGIAEAVTEWLRQVADRVIEANENHSYPPLISLCPLLIMTEA